MGQTICNNDTPLTKEDINAMKVALNYKIKHNPIVNPTFTNILSKLEAATTNNLNGVYKDSLIDNGQWDSFVQSLSSAPNNLSVSQLIGEGYCNQALGKPDLYDYANNPFHTLGVDLDFSSSLKNEDTNLNPCQKLLGQTK